MKANPTANPTTLITQEPAHSESCIRALNWTINHRLAYTLAYPGHCRHCNGWGGYTYSENMSPLGSGFYWPMEQSEPCEHCICEGNCPRCGKFSPAEDAFCDEGYECVHCGWKEGTDGKVELPECDCWSLEFYRETYRALEVIES